MFVFNFVAAVFLWIWNAFLFVLDSIFFWI